MLEWLLAHWTELFGFVTGAACVLLAARRNILTFPVGIASNLVFTVVFIEFALYADAALQLVFIVLGITGWIGWSRSRAEDSRPKITRTPAGAVVWLVVSLIAASTAITLLLVTFTDSTTAVADAATTAGSLVAQFMLNRRWIENWYIWIAVDVAYIGLYAYKGLYITAALYLVFIAMCLYGFRRWRAVATRNPSRLVLTDA